MRGRLGGERGEGEGYLECKGRRERRGRERRRGTKNRVVKEARRMKVSE